MSNNILRKLDQKTNELLDKYFKNEFRSGYVKYGNTFLPEYFTSFAEKIENMDIRDDDIWVCSFPKSGTTWTQEMVWCIANDLNYESAKQFLPERFPFLEHTVLFDYRGLMKKRPEITFPDFVMNSVDYVDKLPSPRFIKSHLPFNLLPKKLQDGSTKAKIIYVARNARDTCVSYYHHCKLLEGYTGDFESFCDLFINGAVSFAPFWEHVLGFWDQRNNPNVLILKYEDMRKDLISVIKKTSNFFNKLFEEEEILKLSDHLSFENMKNNPAVNYEPVIEINKKYNLISADGTFMRCGKVGEWKSIMTDSLIQKFDEFELNNLSKTTFSF